MERKIGEIFERNGEWYQCLEEKTCTCFGCDLRDYNCDDISLKDVKGSCQSERRKDNKSVIFKKLVKVGEPYNIGKKLFQRYAVFIKPYIFNDEFFNRNTPVEDLYIGIEIKQNKEEDMKTVRISKEDLNFLVNKIRYGILPKCTDYDEIVASIIELFSEDANLSNSEKIGKDLKPFDLEAAKAGKPVCTRDGRKARIICFDRTGKFPIVALVEAKDRDDIYSYLNSGKDNESVEKEYDLMMLPEKEEGFINIYRNDKMFSCSSTPYKTRGEAFNGRKQQSYLCTVKVEWEG